MGRRDTADVRPGRPATPPAGTERLVFLFSDIEDSTVLWEQYPDAMATAVSAHDGIITAAVEDAGGRVVKRTGDSMDATFATVRDAAAAARDAQVGLAEETWGQIGTLRVRMAVDVGEVTERAGSYFGPVLNRLGRILAAGHGGQVLLSDEAAAELGGPRVEVLDLGEFRFKGLGRPQRVFQLVADGLEEGFPPLRTGGPSPAATGGPVPSVRGYELREELGRGPWGAVYRAWQTAVGREVAVKVIAADHANRPGFVRGFESAAQSVARLEHPHIVGLFDFWRDPDGAYLVMPLLRGGDLAHALARGPWRPEQALRALEQVGAALSYAHRQGLVHRRLRTSNVLLDEDGNALLSDFALSAARSGEFDGAGAARLVYAAPEQRRGGRIGPHTDVYALGMLTLELLTGDTPAERPIAGGDGDTRLPTGLVEAVATATASDPTERFRTVDDLVATLREVLGAGVASEATDAAPVAPVVLRNPYKGLRPFDEADAGDFHGREALVEELVAALDERRLVAVFGPSGSGKSSLVRAGLIPALRRGAVPGSGDWLITELLPGTHPFEELEAALLRVAVADPGGIVEDLRRDKRGLARVVKRILPADDSELILVVDQFEELFTLAHDEAARDLFLGQLAELVSDERSRARAVLTMRADFADRALDHPGFAELFKSSLIPVTPPTEEELEDAIAGPARSVGLELEPGLAAEIVADVRGQPGSLPLLQHALSELFQRRERDRLTIAAYRESGGVVGALARRAEEVHGDLPEPAREATRQVFLRLVTLGEGTEDTRRRVPRRELLTLPGMEEDVTAVLDAFGTHRLLAFDRDAVTREPTVEVAHEALLRHWNRLHDWIDEGRDDLRRHRRLRRAAAEWRDADRDEAYLLAPARIDAIDDWLDGAQVTLSDEETRYVDASRQRKQRLEATEAERQQHERELERRAVTRLRAAVAVLVLGGLIAAALTLVAFRQQRVAEQQRAAVEHQERAATARALASAALTEVTEDPALGTLLAARAVELVRDDPVAVSEPLAALHAVLETSLIYTMGSVSDCPEVGIGIEPVRVGCSVVAFDATGATLAVAREENVAIIDVSRGEVDRTMRWSNVSSLAFDPDGRLTAGQISGNVIAEDGTATTQIVRHRGATRGRHPGFLAWSSGDLLAVSDAEGRVAVWDASSGERLFEHLHNQFSPPVALTDDGSHLFTPTASGTVLACAVTEGTCQTIVAADEQAAAVAVDPGEGWLATGSQGGAIRIRDVETGDLVHVLTGHRGEVHGLAFADHGEVLVSAAADRSVRVWSIPDFEPLLTLEGHRGTIHSIAVDPAGERVASVDDTGTLRIWRLDPGASRSLHTLAHGSPVHDLAFTHDGELVTADGQAHVWSVGSGELVTGPIGDEASGIGAVAPLPNDRLATLSSPHLALEPPGRAIAAEIWALSDPGEAERIVFEQRGGVSGVDGTLASGLAVSPDGRWLAADEFPGRLRLWDTRDESSVGEFDGHIGVVDAVAFSPDRGLTVTGDGRGRVRLWEMPGIGFAGQVSAHRGPVNALAFSPTGDVWASAGADQVLAVWTREGERVWGTRAHTGEVTGVAFLPDGRLASSSTDGTVRIWDVERGIETLTLTGHLGAVSDVAVSPDGRVLATAGEDRTVRLYLLDVDELLELARERAGRDLSPEECAEYLPDLACP